MAMVFRLPAMRGTLRGEAAAGLLQGCPVCVQVAGVARRQLAVELLGRRERGECWGGLHDDALDGVYGGVCGAAQKWDGEDGKEG